MAMQSSQSGCRIDIVINAAQKLLEEKANLLEELTAEHIKLSEEREQGNSDYLEALRENSILLMNQQVVKIKVDNTDATLSSLENKNDALLASVKDMEERISLLSLSGRADSKIVEFEEQAEKYKQNYLDVKGYCFADNIENMIQEIQTMETKNQKLDEEFASLIADYNKCVEDGSFQLPETPYEEFKLAILTLNMMEDENAKAKACLQNLKGKLESVTVAKM